MLSGPVAGSSTVISSQSPPLRVKGTLFAGLPVPPGNQSKWEVPACALIRNFAVVGPLLLLLAAFGIYAVVSYAVAQRTTELGIRLALGGSTGTVIAEVVGENMQVIAFGAAAGWIVAFVVVRLFPGGSVDPLVFGGVPLLLLLVAGLASWLPARRVGRFDPMAALRVA